MVEQEAPWPRIRQLTGELLDALMANPDQRELLGSEPDLTPPAIEEMLRCDGPGLHRRAAECRAR